MYCTLNNLHSPTILHTGARSDNASYLPKRLSQRSLGLLLTHRRRSGWTSGGRMANAEGGSVLSGVGYGEGCPLSSRQRKRILAYFEGHRTLIFTALHVMQTRYSEENSVRPSVCPSVTRVYCDKTEERSLQIFIPYER